MPGRTKSEDVVKIAVKADKPSDGKQVITLSLQIDKCWHIYANPVLLPDLASAQTVVTVTANGKAVGATIEYPTGDLVKDDVVGDYRIYAGAVTIRATIDHSTAGPKEVVVGFWATNSVKGLLPSRVRLRVE